MLLSVAWITLLYIVTPLCISSLTLKTGKFSIKPLLSKFILPICILANSNVALSADVPQVLDNTEKVYFGLGCFWHVQHEMVETEKRVLNRNAEQLTATTGYAGSTREEKSPNRPDLTGVVCYHNLMSIGDYGKLGYGEVVNVDIPSDKLEDFGAEYFSLFGSDNDRPDKGDIGSEYRSLIGLPGGTKNKGYPILEKMASKRGIRLLEAKGEDSDTLRKQIVWVMDSDRFPFKQAEIYHQFHDGFMPGEQYPSSYNDLVKLAFSQGRIKPTGCPDKTL